MAGFVGVTGFAIPVSFQKNLAYQFPRLLYSIAYFWIDLIGNDLKFVSN